MASSSGDLRAYTTSSIDFYAFLDLSPNFSQKELGKGGYQANSEVANHLLERSLRKTLFKYHPDKVGALDTAARDKFHLANIAYEVLSDPSTRQLYDNAREARERRRKQEEQLQGKRRQFKADLEARERAAASGLKPRETVREPKDEVLDEEERLEREVQRIAEDGMRRRREREEALRRQMKEEEDALERRKKEEEEQARQQATPERMGDWNLGRSVKVKFVRTLQCEALDAPILQTMFSAFGAVEDVVLLEDKRQRLGDSEEKTTIGRALIVFKSTEGAYSAVEDWEKMSNGHWSLFKDVSWAEGKVPEYLASMSTAPSLPLKPKHDISDLLKSDWRAPKQTSKQSQRVLGDLHKLEESTMLRLRLAENRRLEANRPAKYRLQASAVVTPP